MTTPAVGVIGVGAMGSMALWQLARRGVRATGFERFRPGHDRGSSHGETRIIRTSYFEGGEYVPLVQDAWDLWQELEAESGTRLLYPTGAIYIGAPDSALVRGVRLSAERYGIAIRLLESAHLRQRYPQHVLGGHEVGVEEDRAGYLLPEAAVAAAAARAVELGAVIHSDTVVLAVDPGPDSVEVVTTAGKHRFDEIIVTAGAWTPGLLAGRSLPLTPARQVMAWFVADDAGLFGAELFPVFIREVGPGQAYYGFPSTDGRTVKIARHGGGLPADPDNLDRDVTARDLEPLTAYAGTRLSGLSSTVARSAVCMYTNTPDEHFFIGRLPDEPRLTVVSACSGHGFKFAPAIGRVAADLAVDGHTPAELSLFRLDRF